ncbi:putative Ankyrin repeat and KH domain-containing protein 1 [Glarea lozoyensis 74030]|uniref:Putative Ankyrin repeat and KH domain-containing protein 1 n=1 Tax=Glarea lozoyensis (strain ATCC 74030 / MF5533) TaxID=1104152 RepID=H0EP03_GLAL7|nr:putative Ankyrin repeat and KH domain-containing protein 1 [Glarea lozoyensis 74030]
MLLLEKDLSPGTGLRAVARTLRWPYARGEVDKKVQELGRLKNTKHIKLQTDVLAKTLESRYNPGCGKTFLASRIIEDMTSHCSTLEGAALAYFFFDFSAPDKQTYESFLLIYSKSILTLDEIAEVLAIDFSEEPVFSPDLRFVDARDILSVCSSTIAITESKFATTKSEVRLAHASVKDFLVGGGASFAHASKDDFNPCVAHEKIARACMAYLLYLGSTKVELSTIERDYPFAKYAAQNWALHAKQGEDSTRIWETATILLNRNKPWYETLLLLHDVDRPWRCAVNKYEMPNSSWRRRRAPASIKPLAPLYYASLVGFDHVVRSMLDEDVDVNERGGFFGDALSAAAAQGHLEVVKLLIKNGADVDSDQGFQRGPLMAAAAAGHKQVVEQLLEAGADYSRGHYRLGSVLVVAIRNGHEDVVQLLIDNGTDPSRRVGKGQLPTYYAVTYGYPNILKILLSSGAKYERSLLDDAATNHNERAIAILKEHSVRHVDSYPLAIGGLNLSSSQNKTQDSTDSDQPSLQSAAAGGLEATVEQLLNSGVDVDATHEFGYSTALSAAAASGHVSIVKLWAP